MKTLWEYFLASAFSFQPSSKCGGKFENKLDGGSECYVNYCKVLGLEKNN